MKIDPNEPAFPQHGWSSDPKTIDRMARNGGMSYRQWLSGQLAASLCANPEFSSWDAATTAVQAIKHADAIIAALNAEGK